MIDSAPVFPATPVLITDNWKTTRFVKDPVVAAIDPATVNLQDDVYRNRSEGAPVREAWLVVLSMVPVLPAVPKAEA